MKKGIFLMLSFFSAMLSVRGELQEAPVYFLVAEQTADLREMRKESYVLPLTRAADVERAREIIASGDFLSQLPAVSIMAGADGTNRNYLAPGAPLWSWHVTEFNGFVVGAGGTSMHLPSHVESDPEAYIRNSGGYLVFGTVFQELGPVPLWTQVSHDRSMLEIRWYGPGADYSLTVESRSLDDPQAQWQPVEGIWPAKVQSYTIAVPQSGHRIFRVRAEKTL